MKTLRPGKDLRDQITIPLAVDQPEAEANQVETILAVVGHLLEVIPALPQPEVDMPEPRRPVARLRPAGTTKFPEEIPGQEITMPA